MTFLTSSICRPNVLEEEPNTNNSGSNAGKMARGMASPILQRKRQVHQGHCVLRPYRCVLWRKDITIPMPHLDHVFLSAFSGGSFGAPHGANAVGSQSTKPVAITCAAFGKALSAK